jgi:hypothetical protein
MFYHRAGLAHALALTGRHIAARKFGLASGRPRVREDIRLKRPSTGPGDNPAFRSRLS